MALKKTIEKPNGITFMYHRITTINMDVNQYCTICVKSYLSESWRDREKVCNNDMTNSGNCYPFTMDEYFVTDYSESVNIKNAYTWLKKQPEFEGAEDV